MLASCNFARSQKYGVVGIFPNYEIQLNQVENTNQPKGNKFQSKTQEREINYQQQFPELRIPAKQF